MNTAVNYDAVFDSYQTAGLCVIACRPKSKMPYGKGWQEQTIDNLQQRLDGLNAVLKEGTPNFGVLGGEASTNNVICVDVDHLCEETLQREDLQDLLNTAVVVQTGRTGGVGRHIWFRCAEPLGGNSYVWYTKDKICGEVRGRVNTLVPPSIHPETGEIYKLLSGDWNNLPILTLAEVHKLFPKEKQKKEEKPTNPTKNSVSFVSLPPEERWESVDYSTIRWKDLFRSLGLARKEDGDKLHVLCPNAQAHTPDTRSPDKDSSTTIITMSDGAEVFSCLHSHCSHINMAYLTNLYSQHLPEFSQPWKPLPHTEVKVIPIPTQAKVKKEPAKKDAAVEEPEKTNRQTGLSNKDMFLIPNTMFAGQWQEHIVKSALYQQPVLACGAILAACGSLLGRKVMTADGLGTNLYNFGVAPTATGKNHVFEQVDNAIGLAGLSHYLTGDSFTVDTALARQAHERPDSLIMIDECAEILNGMLNSNDSNEPSSPASIGRLLLNWFSKAGPTMTYRGKQFSNKGDNPTIEIAMPCISIYGCTIPEKFFRVIKPLHVKDGLCNRLMLFHTHDHIGHASTNIQSGTPPQEIIQRLIEMTQINSELVSHLTPNPNDGFGRPVPKVIPYAQGALNYLLGIRHKVHQIRLSRKPYFELDLRMEEQVKKIALILAASDLAAEITTDHLLVAKKIVLESIRVLKWHLVHDSGGISPFSEQTQKIHDYIIYQGEWGANRSALARAFRGFNRKEREESLAQLKEAQLIEEVIFQKEGKKDMKPVFRDIEFANYE